MLLLVNKLHFRLLGFTPRRSLSSSLTLIANSTIVMPSRFVTAASHQGFLAHAAMHETLHALLKIDLLSSRAIMAMHANSSVALQVSK